MLQLTNSVFTDIDKNKVRIGLQIRDLRKAKGITLSAIAEKISRSVGYVSQVERGVSSLSISVLQAISEVLGVQITWFFHTENQQQIDEVNYVVRHNSRRTLGFADTGIREELLSPMLSGDLIMVLTTFPPGVATSKEPRIRKGQEAGVLQSGELELTIGDKFFILGKGDSFSIVGDEPHVVRNSSLDEDAVVLWVMGSPGY
ncbi:MAG: transcriptional regulator with XRE-family HTH domain [Pseudohongiellaceae bacterium]|jgi:transcriptional regulator with XRE-family HTH domain